MMESPQSERESPHTQPRERWLFAYTIKGDLRFLSHHDTLRMFVRAIARAALPVRYSRGFNPRPKVSNPLPLPVGVASEAESLIIEFTEPIDGDATAAKLQETLPVGAEIVGARRVETRESFGNATVRYSLDTSASGGTDLAQSICRILDADALPVERLDPKAGSRRVVDVRPYLVNLHSDQSAVQFALRVTGGGTAKPAEIAGLLGFDPVSINHRIQRLEVQWE